MPNACNNVPNSGSGPGNMWLSPEAIDTTCRLMLSTINQTICVVACFSRFDCACYCQTYQHFTHRVASWANLGSAGMYDLDETALEHMQSQARRLLRAARKCDRLAGAARETLCAQLAAAADSAPSLPTILPFWPFPLRTALCVGVLLTHDARACAVAPSSPLCTRAVTPLTL